MILARTLGRWLRHDRDPSGREPGLSTSTTHQALEDASSGELRAVDVDDLLARHAVLVDRIRIGYAGAEGCFEAQVAPLIRRFAAFVHLLPATGDGHFRHAGGCLQFGLEVGFHSLQAVDGQIFSARGTVPERRAAAPRWRAAALAMGLCIEVYRPIFGAAVRDEQGEQWNPLLGPLWDWLRQGRRKRYSIEWPEASAPTRSTTLAILPQILGPSFIEFLAGPDRTILGHMVAAIAAPPGAEPNTLGATVEQTLSRVVARNLRRSPVARPTRPTVEAAEAPLSEESRVRASAVEPEACGTGSAPTVTAPDLAALDFAGRRGVQQVLPEHDPPALATSTAPVAAPSASEVSPPRRLAIPTMLNPVVADALLSLLAPPEGGTPAAGVEISDEGIYVPLAVWEGRGLDTGLVVRALHDARLLVLQGARKVWRKRLGDEDVAGLMLTRSLLA